MIKKLIIQNFQSHKASELIFDKGVNVIVGTSDSGKSSILRALKWVIYNKPLGDSICSNWGGETEVSIHTDKIVSRKKSKSENSYSLGGIIFKAFKSEPPEDIQKHLNMEGVNIQQQLDSHFLLSETPGEIAKFFNKIANLEQIDNGIKNTNSSIKKINTALAFKSEDLKKEQKELERFSDLEKMEIDIDVLNDLENDKIRKTNFCSKLHNICISIKEVEKEIEEKNKITKLKNLADKITKLQENLKTERTKQDKLQELINSMDSIRGSYSKLEKVLSAKKHLTRAWEIHEGLKDKKEDKEKFTLLLGDLERVDLNLIMYNKNKKRLEGEFKNNFPDECPLCGKQK